MWVHISSMRSKFTQKLSTTLEKADKEKAFCSIFL